MNHAARFEHRLSQLADQHGELADLLKGLLLGGKYLRPVLCLRVAEALHGDAERAMRSALALELIHCGALLHDDVYDRDTVRRGVPSLWSRLGDRTAMVVGDLMLGRAFEIMPLTGLSCLARCIGELSRASLTEVFRRGVPSVEESLAVLVGKTASLFRTAAELGGLSADAPPPVLERLSIYGQQMGIAFQIADDLADIETSRAQGRFVGDLAERRPTWPLLAVPVTDLARYVAGEALDESAFLTRLDPSVAAAQASIDRYLAAAQAAVDPLALGLTASFPPGPGPTRTPQAAPARSTG
ncbi:MAG TPA: polyprenyl synthetase family protein [Candidatus Xenobia bacterium]|jgi:geranylgeranyl pyrophosphate synthase